MIELRGVNRDYELGGRPVHALRNVDLVVRAGDYVSLMGPSGSGKSSLLNIIGCLDRPSSGDYILDGRHVATLDDIALANVRASTVGFIFQSFNLVGRLTAAGNVELPMIFAGIGRAARAARVSRALEAVRMGDRAGHRPQELSGGERQRVAIARAIVMGPAILLADEPTGNLDRATGAGIIEVLEAMNADGLTLIVVTHDPAIGGRARRQLKMADGVLLDERPALALAAGA